MSKPTVNPYVILLVAVTSVSSASIFIRLCTSSPLIIAFYRLAFATLILGPITLFGSWRDLKRLSRKEFMYMPVIGFCLALHFAFWITSVKLTSIASSTVIVSLHPVFVALGAHMLLKEKINKFMFSGIITALFGCFLIAYGDYELGRENLLGDLYALVGAITVALYFLGGRHIRRKSGLLAYATPVYASCTIFLAITCLASNLKFYPYSIREYVLFLALALIPMIMGHTLLNWALKYLPAAQVSTSVLGEPIGATILAVIILKEIPTLLTILGCIITLSGVYLTLKFGPTIES